MGFPQSGPGTKIPQGCAFLFEWSKRWKKRVRMSRPEGSNPPDLFYNEKEARKYDASSRIVNIQAEISARAIEMLALPEGQPSYVLDIGCGSGLSGEALEEAGHYWVGCDISKSMLEVRTA